MPPTDEVYIWLGANVMLAYPMDEAETLLVERLGKAKKSLVDCEEDAEFLREQITVSRPLLRFVIPVGGPSMLTTMPDNGGRHGQGVQLGRRAEAQGEGRGGEQRKGRQGRRWLSRPPRGGRFGSFSRKEAVSSTRHGSPRGGPSRSETPRRACKLATMSWPEGRCARRSRAGDRAEQTGWNFRAGSGTWIAVDRYHNAFLPSGCRPRLIWVDLG